MNIPDLTKSNEKTSNQEWIVSCKVLEMDVKDRCPNVAAIVSQTMVGYLKSLNILNIEGRFHI